MNNQNMMILLQTYISLLNVSYILTHMEKVLYMMLSKLEFVS